MHVYEADFISRMLRPTCLAVLCALGKGARIVLPLKVKYQVSSGKPKRLAFQCPEPYNKLFRNTDDWAFPQSFLCLP